MRLFSYVQLIYSLFLEYLLSNCYIYVTTLNYCPQKCLVTFIKWFYYEKTSCNKIYICKSIQSTSTLFETKPYSRLSSSHFCRIPLRTLQNPSGLSHRPALVAKHMQNGTRNRLIRRSYTQTHFSRNVPFVVPPPPARSDMNFKSTHVKNFLPRHFGRRRPSPVWTDIPPMCHFAEDGTENGSRNVVCFFFFLWGLVFYGVTENRIRLEVLLPFEIFIFLSSCYHRRLSVLSGFGR